MKTKVLNFILVCSIIFLFTFCKKEKTDPIKEGVKIGEVKLSNAELNIVPYLLNDSVIFKDSLGNSHKFKVTIRRSTLNKCLKDGGTDITTDYYDIETLSVLLKDSNNYLISFDLQAALPFYCSNQAINKAYFIIRVEPPYSLPPYNTANSFYNYVDSTDFYYNYYGTSIPYSPTLTILNKTFSSVYELTSLRDTSQKCIQTIYYKVSKGMVGFQMNTGEKWYLDN